MPARFKLFRAAGIILLLAVVVGAFTFIACPKAWPIEAADIFGRRQGARCAAA